MIVCLLFQLISFAAPLEGSAHTLKQDALIQKTVRVSEKEILRALQKETLETSVNARMLPFQGEQRDEAEQFLNELLSDALIVKQQKLGNQTAAIVAVRLKQADEQVEADASFGETIASPSQYEQAASSTEPAMADVADIFMLGLNGNKDRSCVFYLEIESEGGIYVEEAQVTGYSALSAAFGPGVATKTEVEREPFASPSVSATTSNASGKMEELSGNAAAATPSFAESVAEVATESIVDIASTSEAFATGSVPFVDEETEALSFRELYQRALNEEELSELVQAPEKKVGVLARLRSFAASLHNQPATATVSTASQAERAQALLGMYAEALGISVLNAKNAAGTWMYFVNLFDPALVTDQLLANTGLTVAGGVEYSSVEATFTAGSNLNLPEITRSMAYYDNGIYRVEMPEVPYDRVQFTIHWFEEAEQEAQSAEINQVYTYALGEEDTETAVKFAFQPVNRDCFFYSGYKGASKMLALLDAKIPGLPASYWSAHPSRNPQSMDSQLLYVDLGENAAQYIGENANYQLAIEYQKNTAKQELVKAPVTLQARDNVLYYQFPAASRANELTLFQLTKRNKQSGELLQTYPFMYTEADGRNLIHISGLEADDWQDNIIWDRYARQNTSTAVLFDNTLNRFELDKGTLVAVVWSADANVYPGRPRMISEEDWADGKFGNEQAFRSMLQETAALGDAASLTAHGIYVAPLVPTTKESAPEHYDTVKNALGTLYPKELTGDLQVRFIWYEGHDLPEAKEMSSGEAGTAASSYPVWTDAEQKTVFQKLLEKHNTSVTGLDGSGAPVYQTTDSHGSGIYDFTRIQRISMAYEYPCFYAAVGVHQEPMQGKWDSAFAVNTLGDGSENTPEGTFTYNPSVYYGTANLYDYYSAYELTGNNREPYFSTETGKLVANSYPATPEDEKRAIGKIESTGGLAKDSYTYQGNQLNQGIADHYEALSDKDGISNLYPLYFFDGASVDYYNGRASKDLRNQYDKTNIVHNIMGDKLQGEDNKSLMLVSGSGTSEDFATGIKQQEGNNSRAAEEGKNAYEAVYFDESFLRGENEQALALGRVYNDVVFPFHRDKNGYWSFDSSVKTDGLRLKRDTENGTYFMEQSAENAVQVKHNDNPDYQFFPFNNPAPQENAPNVNTPGKYISGGYQYGLASLNCMFGMRLDIPFTLTPNGKVSMPKLDENGEPTGELQDPENIVFKFSGDDDVWIYIDGHLALDLGGIHDRGNCEINFGTKKVIYSAAGNENEKKYPMQDRHPEALKALLADANALDDPNATYNTDQHTISIFYMERGLYCSNLSISFNFMVENSFEVKNEVDLANIEAATEGSNAQMNSGFLTAAQQMDSFNFRLSNAVTSGSRKPVEESLGYLKPGAERAFYPDSEAEVASDLREKAIHPYLYENGINQSEVKSFGVDTVGGRTGVFSMQTDETARALSVDAGWNERNQKLVNISPGDETGQPLPSIDLSAAIQAEEGKTYEPKFISFDIWQDGATASANGNALYVGFVDDDGTQIGAWANLLAYADYSNGIASGAWSRIRISLEKLQALSAEGGSAEGFDFTKVAALQLCYYDGRQIAVDKLSVSADFDTSQMKNIYDIKDANISDYGSIDEGGTSSRLQPAAGAWYNMNSEDAAASVLNESGRFSLGMGKSALFSSKFRVGSYLSVRMDALDERIFSTDWHLEEDEEQIPQSYLSHDSAVSTQQNNSLTSGTGRKPEDGRGEKLDVGTHITANEGDIHLVDEEGKQANTILYRSFRDPTNVLGGFHTGVRFVTRLDTALITIRKALSNELTPEQKAEAERATYHFAILYEDVAGMGLEARLGGDILADGFSIQVGQSVTREAIAGTHYRIYELDEPLAEIRKEAAAEGESLTQARIINHASKSPVKIQAENQSNHDDVETYSTGNPEGMLEHAAGTAYTRAGEGQTDHKTGNQIFIFENGMNPLDGSAKVRLTKVDDSADDPAQAKPLEGVIFTLYRDEPDPQADTALGSYMTGPDGTLVVQGLEIGSYYFKETRAPAGYQLNSVSRYPFVIDAYKLNHPNTDGIHVEIGPIVNHKIERPDGNLLIHKVDADKPNHGLPGAVFTLDYYDYLNANPNGNLAGFEGLNDANGPAANILALVKKLDNGQNFKPYYEDIVTGEDGKAELKQLPNGLYKLTETKAPAGYNLLTEPRYFVINAEAGTAKVYEVKLQIENKTFLELPKTGGSGTKWFYIGGFGLLALAFALTLSRRRGRYLEVHR